MNNNNSKIRVGIIENNKSIRNKLSSSIDSTEYAEVAFVIADGLNAVEMIYEATPDAVIIDEALPCKAGIDVISEIGEFEKRPYIIYTMAIPNEILINRAIGVGIDEFVIKPYDVMSIVLRIKNISESIKRNIRRNIVVFETTNGLRERVMEYDSYSNIDTKRDLDKKVTTRIHELMFMDGFTSRHNGYSYIIYAAKLMYYHYPNPYSLSKDIYPAIQDEFDVNYEMTECAIRNAIRIAWKKYTARGQKTEGVFSHFTKKPSNHEFLEVLTYLVYTSVTAI